MMDRRSFVLRGSAAFAGLVMFSPAKSALAQLLPASEEQIHPRWLKRFDDQPFASLLRRRKYRLIMEQCFAGLKAPFWFNLSIHYTAGAYMSNPGTITVDRNRYFLAEGCMCHYGRSRAMLWIDTHFDPTTSVRPAAALAVIDINRTGRNLWVVSNMPLVDKSPNIPLNFRKNLHDWILSKPPKRWETGSLNHFGVLDASTSKKNAIAMAFGVPGKRFNPSQLTSL